ncbi:tRNA (adenosine(37)-N6)-dimethylallyltransferase MiaA [Marinilabiliaceae bacterium JC017]|nr:tRNA (adenosine(37)-N6)-dimethylallyltransferase MiaA [Marinilabiliaceae bacterium JC017]
MSISSPYNLVVVLGPTASGKTSFAAHLAHRINGEIISADSRQVYRSMDLGTGKDYEDYVVNGDQVQYHLVDIADPGYKYNVYEYQADFFKVFDQIQKAGKWPVMCGGTGLYLEAVLKKYKLINVPNNLKLRKSLEGKTLEELTNILAGYKTLHNTADTDTVPRAIRGIEIAAYYAEHEDCEVELPEIKPLITGINIDRQARRRKITARLKDRLEAGMIDEVKQILEQGTAPEDLIYYGLEYKYLTLHVTGKLTYKEMFDQLNTAIHQFAKRQMTWFRKMERQGIKIHWMDAFEPMEQRVERVIDLLKKQQ